MTFPTDRVLCTGYFVACLQAASQSEISLLRSLLEEEKFKLERLEEQINDLTELHQNEMANLKQDMSSMEEKIEYRLDERTTDLSDLVDNCQTRVSGWWRAGSLVRDNKLMNHTSQQPFSTMAKPW